MNVINRLSRVTGAFAGLLTAWTLGWCLFIAGYAVLSLGDHPAHSRFEHEEAIIRAHNANEWDARDTIAQMMLKQDGRTRYRVSEIKTTFLLVEAGEADTRQAQLDLIRGLGSEMPPREKFVFIDNDPDVVPETRWGADDALRGVLNDGEMYFGPACLAILIYIINYIAVGRPRVLFWKA